MMNEKKEERCCILHIFRIVFSSLTPLGRCFGNNLLNRISNSSRFENNEKSEQSGPTQQHKMEYNYYVRIKFRVIAFLFCCLPGMTCTLAFSLSPFYRHLGIHFKFWLLFLFSFFDCTVRLIFQIVSRQCYASTPPFTWMKINSVLCIRPFGISSRLKTKKNNSQ